MSANKETMTIDGVQLQIEWTQDSDGIWIAYVETAKATVTLPSLTKEDVIGWIKQLIKEGHLA